MLLSFLSLTRMFGQIFVPIRRSLQFLAEKPGDKANTPGVICACPGPFPFHSGLFYLPYFEAIKPCCGVLLLILQHDTPGYYRSQPRNS